MQNFFVNPDISHAHTISTDVYRSPEFFEMAKEKIFAHSWQFAGDTDNAGHYGRMPSFYPFGKIP
jgi:choline monooxygenase